MNEDTLHLLSECAAGTDMAIRSLEDVLKNSACLLYSSPSPRDRG